MEENELKQNLVLLDQYRKNIEVAKQIKKKFMDELESNPEYQECCKVISSLNETIEKLTSEIKTGSTSYYANNKVVNPNFGKSLLSGNIKIQDKTTAKVIDENLAFEWAKKDAPHMLILDEKTLLKHAIAVKDTLPLAFVKITEEPVATIASEIKFEE
jgi:hypothetical protein